jgi:phytoene synthase
MTAQLSRDGDSGSNLSARITRNCGKSFYFASYALPQVERNNAYDLYALCRIIDDVTDEPQANPSGVSLQRSTLSQNNDEMLSDRLVSMIFATETIATTQARTLAQELAPILSRLTATSSNVQTDTESIAKFLLHLRKAISIIQIREHHLRELVQGQRDDENFSQPQSWQDFYQYCYRVAGVVGLMMGMVVGAKRDKKTLRSAEHLGIAMQITNILRDVREDLILRQRVYLPSSMCAEFQTVLRNPIDSLVQSPKALELVDHLGNMGLAYYQSALEGVRGIPSWRARLCVKMMAAIYGRILAQILNRPARVFQARVFTTQRRKIWIALQVLLGIAPLRAAGLDPKKVIDASLKLSAESTDAS